MATAGKVTIDLVARTAKLEAGIRRAKSKMKQLERSAKSLRRSFKRITSRVAKFGAALVAAAVIGGAAIIRMQLRLIDTLDKTSKKLGIAAGELQGLRLAAELAGVPVRQLDLGIQRMTRRVAEAAIGTGEAQQAIKDLGIDAKKLSKLPLEQQMQRLAKAFEKVTDSGERVRLGFKLFDSEGVALINVLALGEQGLKDVSQEARDLGLSLSAIDIAKVVKAKDEFTRLKAAITGVAQQLTVKLAPVLLGVAKSLRSAVVSMQAWGPAIIKTIVALTAFIAALKLLRIATRAAASGQAILLALSGPKGWGVLAGAVIAATAAVAGVNKAFSAIADKAREASSEIRIAMDAAEGLSNALPKMFLEGSATPVQLSVDQALKNLAKAQASLDRFLKGAATGTDMFVRVVPIDVPEMNDLMGPMQNTSGNRQVLAFFRKLVKAQSDLDAVIAASPASQAMEKIITALEGQIQGFTKVSRAAEIEALALEGASAGAVEYARSLQNLADEHERFRAFDALADDLERQIITFKMSANEMAIWTLKMEGATDAQLEFLRSQLKSLDALTEAQERANKATREAERITEKLRQAAESIFERTRTPMERFKRDMEELKKILADPRGLIDMDTFERMKKLLEKERDDALGLDKDGGPGKFKQVTSLRHTDLSGGGTAKVKPPTAKVQGEMLVAFKSLLKIWQDEPVMKIKFDDT